MAEMVKMLADMPEDKRKALMMTHMALQKEMHEGRVSVESKLGEGSKFRVTLPAS